MSDLLSWNSLRDRFLAEPKTSDRHNLWQACVDHPRFRAELATCARRQARTACGRTQDPEDIEHDALLILARNLRGSPDLGLDPRRAEQEFAPWIATVIRNACREAARQSRRRSGRDRPLSRNHLAREAQAEDESAFDLHAALDRLWEPSRSVLRLASQGLEIGEIAARLGLSDWKVRRAHAEGIDELRSRLVGEPAHPERPRAAPSEFCRDRRRDSRFESSPARADFPNIRAASGQIALKRAPSRLTSLGPGRTVPAKHRREDPCDPGSPSPCLSARPRP